MQITFPVILETTEKYEKWHESLDEQTKYFVENRLYRLENGNIGQHRELGEGLFELKWRSGIRVYCGRIDNRVVLLWGGSKSKQNRDIKRAKSYWGDYRQKEV